MFNKINNYINNNNFILELKSKYIHITNYTKLITINNNYISVISNNKKIVIKGENLVLKKLLNNELLLLGTPKDIEVLDV